MESHTVLLRPQSAVGEHRTVFIEKFPCRVVIDSEPKVLADVAPKSDILADIRRSAVGILGIGRFVVELGGALLRRALGRVGRAPLIVPVVGAAACGKSNTKDGSQ